MSRKDLQHLELAVGSKPAGPQNYGHENFAAGISPFLRGPYSTMYVRRPWTIRQYAGFPLQKRAMHFTEETWRRAKKDFLLPLTSPRIEATTQTTTAWSAT